MSGICEGRVVVVTGAGRGIGRAHALEFARQGAMVVVNDRGANVDGSGSSGGPAAEVVDEIRAMGGHAAANTDDVSDWQGAERLVRAAVDTFGRLDTLVCNAGILRDRMIVSMGEADWDDVIRVHLKGTFCPVRHAASYWRDQAKAGQPVAGRIVMTSSAAGFYGNIGQCNYSTAKAGLLTFTRVASAELRRYGVTANAIAPIARSRMTEEAFPEWMAAPAEGLDTMNADNVAPVVAWLGSTDSGDVTGHVFEIVGGTLRVAEGWNGGPEVDKGARWDPAEVGGAIRELLAKATPQTPVIGT